MVGSKLVLQVNSYADDVCIQCLYPFDKLLCSKVVFFANISQLKTRTNVFGNYESIIDAFKELRKLSYFI